MLRNPASSLTFTPEKRECAGMTFVGFHMRFKAEGDAIVETASWELGGTARGLSYFDGYRGWHAPPQWMRADAIPTTNPKLMPSLWDYVVCEGYGGEAGLKALTDECKRNNLRVLAWVPAGHLWSKSPVWANHPDWILLNQSGEKFVNPAGGIWHGALDTGFRDYFRDRVVNVVRRFGLDGLWLDTHLSSAQQTRPPDHAARLAEMYCDFARAGARQLLVEGDASAIGSYAIAIGDDWEKEWSNVPEPDLYYGATLAAGSMNPRFYLNHFRRYVAAGAPWIINWDFLVSPKLSGDDVESARREVRNVLRDYKRGSKTE